MKTILIIFIVYWSGFALAWIWGMYQNYKNRTLISPLKAALFSWLVFLILGLHELFMLSKSYRGRYYGEL